MIEAWAVLGRCCVDSEYHLHLVRNVGDLPSFHAELTTLGPGELRLSRWEVNELARLLRIPEIGNAFADIQSLTAGHVSDIEVGFVWDLDFCSVLGLSTIDSKFRSDFYTNAGLGTMKLSELLERTSPIFDLNGQRNHLGRLSSIIQEVGTKTVVDYLSDIQEAGWKSPSGFLVVSCAIGHTPSRYLHVNQPLFEEFLDSNPPVKEALLNHGAIETVDFLAG